MTPITPRGTLTRPALRPLGNVCIPTVCPMGSGNDATLRTPDDMLCRVSFVIVSRLIKCSSLFPDLAFAISSLLAFLITSLCFSRAFARLRRASSLVSDGITARFFAAVLASDNLLVNSRSILSINCPTRCFMAFSMCAYISTMLFLWMISSP